jgi:hypothetical protein
LTLYTLKCSSDTVERGGREGGREGGEGEGENFTTMGVSYIHSGMYQKTLTYVKVKCMGKLLPYKNFMQGTGK